MTAVNRNLHTLAMLDLAFRGVKRSLEQVAPRKPGLRPSHFRLLSFTPSEGIRLTELADRVAMTKQALGEFVATLQQHGYMQVSPDPKDRRARLVRPTQAGERLRAALDEQIATAEREWEAKVGPDRWAIFREVLSEMADNDSVR